LLAVAVGVVLAAQDPPKAGRLLSRRYIAGDRIQYVMKTQNDGSSYEVRITATTRKETDGRFVEDFAWSEMVANGAPRPLAATSQAFRLTVTLEGGAPFDMPDLSKAPGLIGPVTDLMTFYADLFLAMHQGALQKAGDRFCFSNPTASSWADGRVVVLGEDHVDFEVALARSQTHQTTSSRCGRRRMGSPPRLAKKHSMSDWTSIFQMERFCRHRW